VKKRRSVKIKLVSSGKSTLADVITISEELPASEGKREYGLSVSKSNGTCDISVSNSNGTRDISVSNSNGKCGTCGKSGRSGSKSNDNCTLSTSGEQTINACELPGAFIKYLEEVAGPHAGTVLDAIRSGTPEISIRLNPFKPINVASVAHDASNLNDRVSWCSNGLYLKQRPSFTLDPAFHAGAYYVQEPSSMFLEMLRPLLAKLSPASVLDLCAAPGGKSTHLISMLPLGTQITVNEVIKSRLSILRENIVKWGVPGIKVTGKEAHKFIPAGSIAEEFITDLNTSDLNTSGLNASGLNTSYLNTSYLNTSYLNTSDLNTSDLNTSDLNISHINISGQTISDLNSAGLSTSEIDSSDLNATELSSSELNTTTNLNISGLDTSGLKASGLNTSDLNTSYLKASDLNASDLNHSTFNISSSNGSLPDFFDFILVDAPCSGEGMFRKDPAAIQEWSEENVRMCAARQKKIVKDIWNALRPGGVLAYSTCTFNRYENDDNVLWFKKELGAYIISLEEFYEQNALKTLFNNKIRAEWGIQKSPQGGYQFFPGVVRGEGLYLALLYKPESTMNAFSLKHNHLSNFNSNDAASCQINSNNNSSNKAASNQSHLNSLKSNETTSNQFNLNNNKSNRSAANKPNLRKSELNKNSSYKSISNKSSSSNPTSHRFSSSSPSSSSPSLNNANRTHLTVPTHEEALMIDIDKLSTSTQSFFAATQYNKNELHYKSEKSDDFSRKISGKKVYLNVDFKATKDHSAGEWPEFELTKEQALKFLARESLVLHNAPLGYLKVTYGGLGLGFVKNIGSRANNLLPTNLRIRKQ
jgi:16S rRNA C967 or C1407 C5-methylase (RsmB/RsmF family)